MWNALIRTTNDPAATLLRVALGLVILPHGLQKALGWFGGPGLAGTIGFFDQALSVPAALTVLVVLAEVGGGLGLLAGFLSRAAAAGVVAVMAGAVFLVHAQYGFFMNWTGTGAGEGFEYHILAGAIALAVVIKGGGALSVDRAITRRFAEPAEAPRTQAAVEHRPSLAA
jgi:putative oxidoreductase